MPIPGACRLPARLLAPAEEPPDPSRRLVIEGNKAWQAAAEVRKRWLADVLFARRSAPREAAQFVARQLLSMPEPLRTGLAIASGRLSFSEITRQDASRWLEICDTTAAARLPLLMLAPIAVTYEYAMTQGEGRNTWRTDNRYSPCPRTQAGHYLAFLASVGYQLTPIERAVADGVPWTGDTPAEDSLPADDDSTGADGPGTAEEPDAGGQPGASGAAPADGQLEEATQPAARNRGHPGRQRAGRRLTAASAEGRQHQLLAALSSFASWSTHLPASRDGWRVPRQGRTRDEHFTTVAEPGHLDCPRRSRDWCRGPPGSGRSQAQRRQSRADPADRPAGDQRLPDPGPGPRGHREQRPALARLASR